MGNEVQSSENPLLVTKHKGKVPRLKIYAADISGKKTSLIAKARHTQSCSVTKETVRGGSVAQISASLPPLTVLLSH